MIHMSNDVHHTSPITLGNVLDSVAWIENLRPHRLGVLVDLVSEVRICDGGSDEAMTRQPAWREVSTYLIRGAHTAATDHDSGDASHLATTGDAPQTTKPPAHPPWAPPLPTARWVLPAGTARAYAAISGDHNPIHMSAIAAKTFGFPRSSVHGMYSAARALAEVGPIKGATYRWTVSFGRPVQAPSTVDVAITPATVVGHTDNPTAMGFSYEGWNAARNQRHFRGAVTPL
ncbi:MAG: hypothetical protein LBB54_02905, partial [Cellulomonadaceae bacterium]|jgi:acyl dehydratase|nr:hypothetical protein [Cellulomonadaceae bacterium]